eukprot:TRINITY_DN50761_c0_g1_i1.p1 TRINITY_DN50761_c0_g1~~TRINITY_DN50761_c0_g1_i1.p1  ORF type:complete len:242 (+),score=33.18 TRINITY_DN50761_c0_g1_i1:62-727(+)
MDMVSQNNQFRYRYSDDKPTREQGAALYSVKTLTAPIIEVDVFGSIAGSSTHIDAPITEVDAIVTGPAWLAQSMREWCRPHVFPRKECEEPRVAVEAVVSALQDQVQCYMLLRGMHHCGTDPSKINTFPPDSRILYNPKSQVFDVTFPITLGPRWEQSCPRLRFTRVSADTCEVKVLGPDDISLLLPPELKRASANPSDWESHFIKTRKTLLERLTTLKML